ncbi:MAG: bifunctional diaminohydroxyphosphoribosylaminopyrimidine deaminase/5-amino-6-(5-phosphoribosylamino)uracil reductase RibD [Burkholderiaceae bacterium]
MPTDALDSHYWMRRALERTRDALHRSDPNPRVGCVLVRDDVVIGEGATQASGGPHAEIEALADARARGLDARGATAWVTLEPCSHFGRTPPCVDALIAAGIARVVAAMQDPNPLVAGQGFERLRAAGIAVDVGPMADEARELNIGFVTRMVTRRPWVRMKLAASLDAQGALANGQSQWITSEAARRDGHAWRARASALLTGIGTVRADDPRLDVRSFDAPHDTVDRAPRDATNDTPRQPLRVLVDSRFDVPLSARIVRNVCEGKRLLVVGAVADPNKQGALADAGCETLVLPNAHGKVDLGALIDELGRRDVNELHVEAGGKLNGSLIRAGCVDELLAYLAPCLLGPGQPMIELPPIDDLGRRRSLTYHDSARSGDDLRIRARFDKSPTGA